MAGKQVMLDGQILHGRDRYGWWQILTMEGWDATPEPKTDAADRVNADGDFDTEVHYSRRLVTLTGRLIATSPEQAEEARTRLTGLLHQGGIFSVTSGNGTTKWGSARRGRIVPGPIRGRYLTFQMELRFPDPYKYGAQQSEVAKPGEPAFLVNRGNAQAWSIITITGSMPLGYKVILNGVTIDVIEPLVTGKPHVIDMKKRRITINGVWGYGLMDAPSYPSIRPGARQAISFVPFESGTGQAVVAFNDTYI